MWKSRKCADVDVKVTKMWKSLVVRIRPSIGAPCHKVLFGTIKTPSYATHKVNSVNIMAYPFNWEKHLESNNLIRDWIHIRMSKWQLISLGFCNIAIFLHNIGFFLDKCKCLKIKYFHEYVINKYGRTHLELIRTLFNHLYCMAIQTI